MRRKVKDLVRDLTKPEFGWGCEVVTAIKAADSNAITYGVNTIS